MGASATLLDQTASVDPGREVAVRVRIQNTGAVVDRFELEVLGDAVAWATVDPPFVSLFPGKDETATIRFRPPRVATVPAGTMPFGVRVTSHEERTSVVDEGTLTVTPFRQTAAELAPRNSRASRSGRHELGVANAGNVPIDVALQATDPDAALAFRFRPPVVRVPPGRTGFSRVRVTARSLFLTGTARSRPFRIQVAPEGEPAIPVDGSLVQEPLISRLVRNVAIVAVLAVIGAALLWFFAIKPGVESAAKAAVSVPLAQQSAAIAQLQKQVAPGAGAGQPGGTTPTPGGGAAGPAGSGGSGGAAGGATFARRLSQAGGQNQYRVPAGATLSVTDVVFQNPAGEHGTVMLQWNGNTLLVENLDNFRDLDYHFVTPITATGNQTVALGVQCPTGCPNVGLYLNGTERPGG